MYVPVLADRDNPILLRDQHRRVHAVTVALDLVQQDESGALGPRVDLRRHDSLCATIPPLESAERSEVHNSARYRNAPRRRVRKKTSTLRKGPRLTNLRCSVLIFCTIND